MTITSCFNKFPQANLGNIILREMNPDRDAQKYLELLGDPLVNVFLSDEDVPTNVKNAENIVKYWRDAFRLKRTVFWALADAQSGEMMGTIGFCGWNASNRRAEICYELMPKYWRKGIMTKALNWVLSFAFREMEAYRIEARTMMGNVPSGGILRKMGFQQEGILRGYRIIRGKPEDILLFSLVAPDFSNCIFKA